MGGSIIVKSNPNEGSEFTFTIRAKTGNAKIQPVASGSEMRLLVVDDMPYILEMFGLTAQKLGILYDAAESGEKALAFMEKEVYNLIFIDWKMPDMDGVELSRRITEIYGDKVIIIMISSADLSEVKDVAYTAGVKEFVSKPILLPEIANILDKYSAENIDEIKTNTADFSGKTVMLVEDVPINREIVEVLLEDTGITIVPAENGDEALKLFNLDPFKYDLIFMDIHMPVMDGYEATRQIRSLEMPNARTIPIIAMTANVFKEDVEKCIAAGMNDHVGKPIDMEQVLEKIQKYAVD